MAKIFFSGKLDFLACSFLFLCLLLLLGSNEAKSQIMAGPKVGFNLARVDFRDPVYRSMYNNLPVPGFNAGVMGNFRVNDVWSLHTEFLYSLEGKLITNPNMDFQSNLARYHFVRMPILFRYTIPAPFVGAKFYLNVGPNISRWLGGTGEIFAFDFVDVYENSTMPYRLRLKPGELSPSRTDFFLEEPIKWHLGMDFGGGAVFSLSKKHRVVVDIRYLYGHSFYGRDIDFDMTLGDYFENFQSSPRVWSFSIGYLYDIDLYAWAKGKSTSKEK